MHGFFQKCVCDGRYVTYDWLYHEMYVWWNQFMRISCFSRESLIYRHFRLPFIMHPRFGETDDRVKSHVRNKKFPSNWLHHTIIYHVPPDTQNSGRHCASQCKAGLIGKPQNRAKWSAPPKSANLHNFYCYCYCYYHIVLNILGRHFAWL